MGQARPTKKRSPNVRPLLSLLCCAVGGILLLAGMPAVALTWDTASEVGTAGFNIYRKPESDAAADWERVNEDLVPAAGDEVAGATYRYEDDNLRPGRQYRYRIEEVEWDGRVTQYPDEVVVRAGLPSLWTKVEGGGLLLLGLVVLWRHKKIHSAIPAV